MHIFAAAVPNAAAKWWHALLQFGTVLGDGEDVRRPRIIDAAGHGVAVAFAYHATHERGGREGAGGEAWLAGCDALADDDRRVSTDEGHLV